MLSIRSISAKDAYALAKYYESQSAIDDYYEEGEEPPGEWMGSGAAKLGLSGELKDGELLAGMQGFHPGTGDQLAKNAGDKHKPGWDATFSAPKSVSAAWAIAEDSDRDKIAAANKSAVASSLDYLEREAVSTRHGHGGAEKRESGGLTVAAYEHGTNRNQDPQLHTHCIIMNMSPDGRGIDFDTHHKMAAGALYRTELASQLQEMGFQVERDGDSFGIKGMNQELTDHWSSRRDEIQEELARTGNSGAKAANVAALSTRDNKESVSRDELHEKWGEQAEEYGVTDQYVKNLTELEAPEPAPTMKSGAEIMEELTQKRATVTDVQIRAAVAVESQGFLNAKEAEQFTDELLESEHVIALKEPVREEGEDKPDHIKGGQRYTTQGVLDAEQDMLDRADRMNENDSHQISDRAVNKALDEMPTITDEQKSAVRHITQESGQIAVMQGQAGAGKSFTLGAVREAYENDGFTVIGTAVSNAATRNLKNEAGIESKNTTLLEIEIGTGRTKLDEKTVIVVDEAGMQSTRQTASLLEMAEDAGAKVVLVGDTRQLQAIESGAPMRAIADRDGIGMIELKDVRRQKTERERTIAGHFRVGRAGEGLAMLKKDGHFHVEEDMVTASRKAANGYLSDMDEGKSSIVVAASRREVGLLNGAIREGLQERGQLGDDAAKLQTSTGLKEFASGDKVIFGKKHAFGERGDENTTVWNGATGQVEKMEENGFQVKLDHSGESVSVDFEEMYSVSHGYATTVHKAQGLSVDRAHVLAGNQTGREWSYVAASRHKESVNFYTDQESNDELTDSMRQAGQKDMASDYDAKLGTIAEMIEHELEDEKNNKSIPSLDSEFDEFIELKYEENSGLEACFY
ncbi:MAG: MobF family relaxase [Methylophaga sp.]